MIQEIAQVLAIIIGAVILYYLIGIHRNLKKEKIIAAKLFLNKKRIYRMLLALFAGTVLFFVFGILLACNIEFPGSFLLMFGYWLSFPYFGYQFKKITEEKR
ncbi:MAG: hypothetical protein U9N35_03180 [Euryarchaeota archaeon]|nr:hypothetical protein [Euryarchaeota archaeon]